MTENTDFSATNLSHAKFWNMDLTGAKFTGALFYDTELQGSDLSGVDLRGAKFGGYDANFDGTKFVNADMRNIDGYQEGVSYPYMEWKNVDLSGANLSGSTLNHFEFTNVKFNGSDLSMQSLVAPER